MQGDKTDFQIFQNYKKKWGSELIYLDNAASSLVPDYVVEKMNEYYFKYKSNIDRGLYKNAEKATYEYEEARKKLAQFIGANSNEIIFTAGATDSANKIILMLEYMFTKNKNIYNSRNEIVVSKYAHHSDLVPLQEYAKRNNLMIKIGCENLSEKTLIFSHMYASNVTGEIFEIKDLCERAKILGALFLVDATANIGHMPINVKDLHCDILYFGSHKMCGPTGVGVIYVRQDLLREMEPVFYGGGIVYEVFETISSYRSDIKKFEAGTSNIAGVIGFGYAIDYLNNLKIEKIRQKIENLTAYAFQKLRILEEENKIKIYAKSEIEKNIGIISFEVLGVHAHDVAQILADNHIAVRSGHHCAQLLMRKFCVPALTRTSFYFYNDKKDIDKLVEGIKKVLEKFK